MDRIALSTKNITKKYTDSVGYTISLFEDISVIIETGQFATFLAPKGTGKSSLLKILAEIDTPSSGLIESNSSKKVILPSKPSSFPWLNVRENIQFNSTMSNEEIQDIVNMVGLQGYEDHYPHEKSLGFRFRMSLGRALANGPDIILIDEPFNNLNSTTRKEIYTLLISIKKITSKTIIFGTTNISEAILLSDKIYLMKKNPGEIIDDIEVKFSEERNVDILGSEEFVLLRKKIENIFINKADRMLYNFSI